MDSDSDIISFANHPACQKDWNQTFKIELNRIDEFIKKIIYKYRCILINLLLLIQQMKK